jgi:beta-lactamase superfamily II metal-dependent hydrolase
VAFELPPRGFVFWPVGNGDSTTIVIDTDTHLQVDLHHCEKANDDDDPFWAVVDELVSRLPKRNGRSYLAAFALTHPDQDHCRGFAELLRRAAIGELWFTPRVYREYKKDLCDDALAFCNEAKRRVKATIAAKGDPGAGHRVRIFGYSPLLEEDEYKGFPAARLVIPGNALSTVDEVDLRDRFRAFVHAPFKDDLDGDRNDTSLALQVTLLEGQSALRALLFGDLAYPTLKRIFEISKDEDLAWNVLLAPHHCSKSAMYWQDQADSAECLKQELLDKMAASAATPNHVVSSSNPVPETNGAGDDPPHAKAKKRYEEITEDGFLCTQEHPNQNATEPIAFGFGGGAPKFLGTPPTSKSASEASSQARGGSAPPASPITYGRSR